MSTGIVSPLKGSPRGLGSPYPYRGGMGMMSSAEFAVFHDEMFGLVTSNVPSGWTAAIIDTGATLVTATTGASHGNGAVVIASDGTSEGVSAYLPKNLKLTAGKKFFMEVRVQTAIAAETDVQFGLSDLTATTNPEDLWTTTAANLIAFGTLAGSATTTMLSDKSNSGTAAQVGTKVLADATWHTLAISYDGDKIRGFVDGKQSVLWSSANTTIPTATALAPFIGARTGATAGNVTVFDYVRIVMER